MAHIGKLPQYQRLITTHNSDGKAVLSDAIDATVPWQGDIENGSAAFSLAYTSRGFPAELKDDKDITRYQDLVSQPPGLVKMDGTVLRVVDMAPGATCAMHRTVSLDYGVVLIGDIELILDSGESRAMKQGDICVQRATMHAWKNLSETDWARMLFVLQPSEAVRVGGKSLEEDYGGMIGVPKST